LPEILLTGSIAWPNPRHAGRRVCAFYAPYDEIALCSDVFRLAFRLRHKGKYSLAIRCRGVRNATWRAEISPAVLKNQKKKDTRSHGSSGLMGSETYEHFLNQPRDIR